MEPDPAPDKRALRVALLGRLRVQDCNGGEVDIRGRHARSLLAMLCIASEPLEREFVGRLLWPGRFPAQAKASLRQCIFELTRLLKARVAEPLEVGRDTIFLRRGAIVTDVEVLLGSLAVGDPVAATRVLEQAGGLKLLDQFSLGSGLAEWIDAHARAIETRIAVAVSAECKRLDATGQTDLRDRLRAAHSGRFQTDALQAAAVAPAHAIRIAVLPFELVSRDKDDTYFSDGLVAELITVLSRISGLQIAGRTSSFHFRDTALPIQTIAEMLHVTHLVEGTVQRDGQAVRILVRLIDGHDGFETWSGIYSGTLDSIFAVQESVATAITAAISEHFGQAVAAPAIKRTTASQQAYDLYLRGRELGARTFGDNVLVKARELLESSLAIDPDFAEAWLALSEVHHNTAIYTHCADRSATMEAMASCAQRALELDGKLSYARSLLAIYQFTRNNMVGGLELALEAYHHDPDHPEVAMRAGSLLIYCGLTSQAEPLIRKAVARDPVDPRKYALLSAMLLSQGDLHGAQNAGQKMVDFGWPSMYLAIASAALGQHGRAVEEYQITKRLMNTMILPPLGAGPMTQQEMDGYWAFAARGVCSGQEADRVMYCHLLERLYNTLPDKADNAICGPAIYTGNAELVFKTYGHQLTAAILLNLMLLWNNVDPIRRIWQHNRFPEFAFDIGMVAAWERFGWPDLLQNDRARFAVFVSQQGQSMTSQNPADGDQA